jgi:hypothetical protein
VRARLGFQRAARVVRSFLRLPFEARAFGFALSKRDIRPFVKVDGCPSGGRGRRGIFRGRLVALGLARARTLFKVALDVSLTEALVSRRLRVRDLAWPGATSSGTKNEQGAGYRHAPRSPTR